ncbi:glutamine synthetase [Streptomyces pactum]|uniref:Glutamine synthetase n=1 Tax=Streptomyces pactum TaxID=68249 RepID=A0ABS0NEH7_9ACTN|nr:glutamine synthetase family protein [Streptomyces pactum]MBH5333608.1 glutamine synthetase [Streptomyces pactum]
MVTEQRDLARARARQEVGRLIAAGVRGTAVTWVDNAGLTRVKAVPTDRLEQVVSRGVGMSPVFDVFLVDDSITDSRHVGGPDGDLRLFPDLSRLTPLAAQPGWAWAPADRYDQRGAPHPVCQRWFAHRMTERARRRGLEVRVGFETEWVVMPADGPAPGGTGGPAPGTADTGPAYGMARLVAHSDYLAALLDALHAQHVPVLQLHPEYAPGQFEISAAPAGPVEAADTAVLVRETVRGVSARHRLAAVFGPVVEPGQLGNGGHLHLSLRQQDRNLCRGGDGPFGMTATCEAFLAGVLRELPALLAVGAPSPASYLRLVPSRWAGAYRCWGLENREAALRFICGPADDPDAANAEVKCFDAAANPYLAVGAVIAAGLAGIDAGLRLPPPVAGDPARADEPPPRLPESLEESVRHFEESAVLREALGEPLWESVAAVRRAECALFAGATPQEIAAATRRRY